jgi:two-component system chemotaxis sensor kinase CheA
MSPKAYADSFIVEALPAFISEAQEQTDALEQLLLQLEGAPADRELLDALFRCAHTVKGSAGIFGLDDVVSFTHHVETLLDLLRDGSLGLTPDLSTLLLQSNDQIRLLVAAAAQAPGEPPAEVAQTAANRAALVQRLQAASGIDAQPALAAESALALATELPCWQLSVQFGADTYRNGMDPLAILNYVRGLGRITQLVCDATAVPALQGLDPESCHLSFDFNLLSAASRVEIESAFSFVREDCTLRLTEPGQPVQDFAERLEALPDKPLLGDLLLAVGAVTQTQLTQGLKIQAQSAASPGHAPTLGEILHSNIGLRPQVVNAALQMQARHREAVTGGPGGTNAADDNRFIRVEAQRLDEVIDLLGELVTASAGGLLLARQSKQRALLEANQQISSLISDIRNGTLQLRMVPIGETFARFRRVVRDTAAELSKDVHLEIIGGDTELDKSVVEKIADPLMHLVRNALDHGLETPAQRADAGKTEQAKLTLSACHEGGGILIRILDNGRGIQRDRVLARAWERGLVEPGVTPADEDILKLIFEPGFSTAEKVTNLSGRGVGMDVVRRNIEQLRGSIMLSSEPGQGSSIDIRLPLTLAIIDGFLVAVGPSKFIFPLDAVVEVIETRPNASAVDARGRSVVELRGQVLPVVSLRALYALDSEAPERSSVVVIRSGGVRYGVLVDQLLGQHQTVIKPLGRMFRSLRGMSGSSILGNGEVALIFDVGSLAQLAASDASARAKPAAAGGHTKVTQA